MKKRFFYLFPLFILLLSVVCSCKDDNNEPTPPEPSPEITIPSSENLRPVLNQEGGTVSISFTATADWTASLINTRAESWITVTPNSGSKGKNEITITTTANETYDERNATVVLKCGTVGKNIVVTQKQKDALTVTSSKYEVDSKGGNISVEVKANINFEVEVKADWIKQVKSSNTRALVTSNLNFTIEPNETGDKREGEIIIKSGELSETIKVYQGYENFITLTKKDFTIPEEGGNVDIEIKSTLNYEVKMLSDVDWITEVQSRAVSTHTHHYTVSPNETYDSREAKIVFYDSKDESVADTVSIYQMYKGAILVARNEYQFGIDGGTLDLTVQTNLEFNVEVSDTWIQQIQPTRALSEYNLSFAISENTEQKDREGTITVKDKNSDKKQTIIVKQSYVDLEREALIALYKATNGDNWTNNTNWCSDKPISEWYGITVQDGELWIDLQFNNLVGELPKEIGSLKRLTYLFLLGNKIIGTIPEEIGNLDRLTILELSSNSIEGTIPKEIGKLKELRVINLGHNTLEGNIPEWIIDLPHLETFNVYSNQLNGNIPEDIGRLTGLKNLELGANQLSGNIPESIGNLSKLERIDISWNQINGNILESIGNLTNLRSINFNSNLLSGSIPKEIGNLTNLKFLELESNQLSGNIPESIGYLTSLESLLISRNQFAGNFPESMKNLVNLKRLEAVGCNFEGNIPKWFENLPLEDLNLQWNRFNGSVSMNLWNKWGRYIAGQQYGYIVSPEDYYVSTDFSKDGEITVLQTHSKGSGIKLVLMGDLFVDKDMGEGGKYETLMKLAMENVFSIEPVKSLREYFDVIAIKAVSENDWMSGKTAFETLSDRNGVIYNIEKCEKYAGDAVKAVGSDFHDGNVHIIVVNLGAGAQTGMSQKTYGDGWYTSSISCCRYTAEDPDYFEDLIHHEVVGHGLGLLYDEYVSYSGQISSEQMSYIKQWYNEYGWYANVDFTANAENVKWAHFINDSRYKDEGIGIYEGAVDKYGIYRSTEYSTMREGVVSEDGKTYTVVGQFNAPSREAIYKNIMRKVYGNSWTYDYEEFVKFDAKGHADWMEAINKVNTRSVQSNSKSKQYKHIPPKILDYPAVAK